MHLERARQWRACLDPTDEGITNNWAANVQAGAVEAPVPGTIQQIFPDRHGIAWYWCSLAPAQVPPRHQALLRFESVDYAARVWLNGHSIGSHQGEGPFELDATEHFLTDGANLLAVRVVNPTGDAIDGLLLSEVPHANKTLPEDFRPGWAYNFGGILGDVVLHVKPEVRLLDIFARPDLATGVINVEVSVSGAAVDPVPMLLDVLVSEGGTGIHVAGGTEPVLPGPSPGAVTVVHLQLQVPPAQLKPWHIDEPFLYTVRVRLQPQAGGVAVDERDARVGFRQLRVRNGWFELNGRRIYLRSTHTGNHYPIGQAVPPDPAFVRQDLVFAKAAGFNMVRFIAGLARQDQLDFCDELGLMVYEETHAAWLLADSPKMSEHFDHSYDDMVRRDRNHPSVVIWGLLNETYDGPVFRHAVGYLERLRQLDDTRLVLLSSGRWDGDLAVGSVCNPGEEDWCHEWGLEQAGAAPVHVGWANQPDRGAYVPGAGDLHLYPALPEPPATKRLVRTMGTGQKPVFLSEYGVGSLFDAVTALAEATSFTAGATSGGQDLPLAPDVAYVRSMAEAFISDWERYGMDRVYCFPEDALAHGELNQSRHRAATFDLIRANGNIAGYNLTGMLDHALTGEGGWTFWRRWKPGAMDATAAGWWPLRWCLDLAPAMTFPGGEVELDLSLASEDVLPVGQYPASVAIVGPGGWRWERRVEVVIDADPGPLAVPVLTERVTLDGGPGLYHCGASLGLVAAPAAGRATVKVVNRPPPLARQRAAALGFGEAETTWLQAHGVDTAGNCDGGADVALVLVGHAGDLDEGQWRGASAAVHRGATALVLAPWELATPGQASAALPFETPVCCTSFRDWLYHKECFATTPDLVEGLAPPGLMEWRTFGPVLPRHLLDGDAETVAAFAVAIGYPCPGGYTSGLVAATFRQGAGRLIVSSFDLLAHLGALAVADQLVANLLHYAASDQA